MNDSLLLAGFSRDQSRRGLEPTTIESRLRNFRLFCRWLGGTPLAEVTREDVEVFLDSRRIGSRARCRWLSDLHSLYGWAVVEGHLETDPTARIVRPRLTKLIPRPIASDDLSAAIELAPHGIRCVLLLAAYEGMRCIEISRLVREDILETMEPAVIIARGKGSKSRALPIHPEVWRALRSLPLPRAGWVFLRPDGRQQSPKDVSRLANDYLHDLGLETTIHKLRHWFGTSIYQSTHDLLLVRDLLGHADVTTTEGYAAFDRAGAAAAIERLTVRS